MKQQKVKVKAVQSLNKHVSDPQLPLVMSDDIKKPVVICKVTVTKL